MTGRDLDGKRGFSSLPVPHPTFSVQCCFEESLEMEPHGVLQSQGPVVLVDLHGLLGAIDLRSEFQKALLLDVFIRELRMISHIGLDVAIHVEALGRRGSSKKQPCALSGRRRRCGRIELLVAEMELLAAEMVVITVKMVVNPRLLIFE